MNNETKSPAGEIYIQKEVADPSVIQVATLIIDEWATRLPYSPIGTFSTDTTFLKMIDHACFKIEIETQVVNRTLQENHIPDDAENCPDNPESMESLTVWSLNCPLELDFKEHKNSTQISSTRQRVTCNRCDGNGKTTCAECDGDALVTCGKGFFSSGCGGSGQVDVTRDVREWRTHDSFGIPIVGQQGGEWRTRKEVIGTKNCSKCHGSGQVKCEKCNRGLVQCDRCEGKCTLIKYISVEQKEFPIKGITRYISSNLPSFRSSKKNPSSDFLGDLCFTQDQGEIISSLDMPQAEENDILTKTLNGYFESDQKFQEALGLGKIFRQVVKIYNCPVSEYFYYFKGNEYSIFVNRETKIIEDLTGPIAQESENLLDRSKKLAAEKKYLKSFAANQKAKTLLSGKPWEIKVRKALVEATELVSLGIEKSKQLFSKLFKKSSLPEIDNEK